MQRRNVDLPEPEGPSRHITSPADTSSVIPLSTSLRPKRLWTPSAFTIGALTGARLRRGGSARRAWGTRAGRG